MSTNLVRVGNQLHPITHTFVVRERYEQPAPPPTPAILECYNTFWQGLNISRAGVGMSAPLPQTQLSISITFAANNLNWERREWWPGNPQFGHELHGDTFAFAAVSYAANGWQRMGRAGLVVGGLPDALGGSAPYPGVSHFGGGNNQIVTLSFDSPTEGVQLINPDLGQRFNLPRQRDMVFWLYDFRVNSSNTNFFSIIPRNVTPAQLQANPSLRLGQGSFKDFLAEDSDHPYIAMPGLGLGSPIPISDDLFQPGQQGMRIISSNYADAPWLRYPHLM